ncbi:hypothetical protein [Bradyrhizobium sp. McL0616]|uniref:hypothetical protein n=1 Tax=Bradyrhizobium sp. McL0616 TaxID=3415674 RepID=UPI003CE973D0
MTSTGTDGDAGSQAQSSFLRKGSEQAFTLTFLITSAVMTIGWLYALTQGAMAATNWLFF